MADDDNVIPLDEQRRKTWHTLCVVNDKGKIVPNVANMMQALRYDPAVRDCYAHDQMLHADIITHEIGRIDTADRIVTEADIVDLAVWLQRNGLPSANRHEVRAAITLRAQENAFHPVRQYLASLVWDEVPRIGIWLTSYLGAELNHYNAHIGRMFITSMVARIISPGCQVDHMIVLEGPQGILKSSACRVLGGEWFSDALPEIGAQRETSQHLRGKWLLEVAEMHAMSRAEATQLKSFISRREERYLARYGRQEVFEPRQCVFIGTTNQDQYLRDATGGRRFWPVKTGVAGRIQIELLEEYRDQLFAEAVHNYFNGGTWWPDAAFERDHIMPQQAERYAGGDIWLDQIEQYLNANQPAETTCAALARDVLGVPTHQMRHEHALRIGSILRELGWKAHRTKTRRFWTRVGEKPSPTVITSPDDEQVF